MSWQPNMSRTTLYVPGDRPDRFDKALASGADAIICDLEDAVAEDSKALARQAVAEWLRANSGAACWVRVNNRPDLLSTDAALVRSLVADGVSFCGVVLPKATPAACETDFGGCGVMALIESAAGVIHINQIASQAAVVQVALGEEDLAADLGMQPSVDAPEMWAIRTAAVVASAAAGLQAPVGPVFTNLEDEAGLAATSHTLRRQGFGGRAVIHPKQVNAVHLAFTPTSAEIAKAQATLEAFAAAAEANSGVAVVDGRFIDAAVVRWAKAVLARVPVER
ncbi:MAG: CoA ester lyase [bacterium]|nr:CoA ester lyase [bacterium]